MDARDFFLTLAAFSSRSLFFPAGLPNRLIEKSPAKDKRRAKSKLARKTRKNQRKK